MLDYVRENINTVVFRLHRAILDSLLLTTLFHTLTTILSQQFSRIKPVGEREKQMLKGGEI